MSTAPALPPIRLPSTFADRLIAWQQQCGRHHLPWQESRDPYRVWLSEIMLQQTQVVTVIPYYQRFLAHFPDLAALANAPLDAVLGLWSGLGYYARARHLHACAQAIMSEHAGVFPSDPALLAELPGIGRSTAAAIAAFAFGKRAAILDGNVKRVLCRHLGIEVWPGRPAVERELWQLAEALLPASGIESYTQGLMDLGATVCTRRQPRCSECPLAADCQARLAARQDELPVPPPRKALPERTADWHLFFAAGHVLLRRRPPSGLWGGLLTAPETDDLAARPELLAYMDAAETAGEIRHVFTHFRLRAKVWRYPLAPQAPRIGDQDWVWLAASDIAGAALPTPLRRLLTQLAAD